jgi:hypothetical protein
LFNKGVDMAGMALFLSWVPCVAGFAFIAGFMKLGHQMEEAKRLADAQPEQVVAAAPSQAPAKAVREEEREFVLA